MLCFDKKTPSLALSAALGLSFLAPSLTAAAPPADTVSPGLASVDEHPVGLYDAYATLPNGERVVFDGSVMWREAEDGTFLQQLGSTIAYVYPSFVLPDPTATYALIGESSRGKIYRVDLAGAGVQVLADLDFNFDARFEDAGHVLVSAAPCGFACGNEIYRIDLSNGAASPLATVHGPSGPLALGGNGDLFYGLIPDYPAVTGSILRWSAAQVASGALLDETSAVVLDSGIDPVSSMGIEPVFGHLFVTIPVFQGTSRVVEYTADGQLIGTVAESLDYLSGLEFARTAGIGSFQAFQPDGVRLRYRASDYSAGTSVIRTIRARRPRASASGPGLTGPGYVTFTVKGAHPSASFLVLMGLSASYNPNETSYDYGSFLFHTGMPLGGIRRLGSVPTDANGEGNFTFFNPGGLQGTRVLQAMIRDSNGRFVGSSTEAYN